MLEVDKLGFAGLAVMVLLLVALVIKYLAT